ncbi:MAG: hypothetical protein AMXMBFR7_06550 [Planctomycetota bacterium]
MCAQPIPAKKPAQGGNGCLLVFGLIFLTAGIIVSFAAVGMVHKGYRAHTAYLPAQAVILDKQLIENSDSDGTTYRAEFTFTFRVAPGAAEAGGDGIPYTVKGYDGMKTSSSGRSSHQEILDAYQVGQTYPCWYDPDDPNQAVLVKPSQWNLLWLLFPVPFVGFGLFAASIAIRNWARRGEPDTPPTPVAAAVPKPAAVSAAYGAGDLNAEQGSKLPHRLKSDTAEKAAAIGLGCFGLIWTAVSGTMWVASLSGGDWLGLIFLSLFVLLGLGILGAAVWQGLIGWGVGVTTVEVSTLDVAPGDAFQVIVSQSGRALQVNHLAVYLVCEEKATYRQGTDTRTATEVVLNELQTERSDFVVSQGQPEELTATVTVPAGAMHSFEADKNKIVWKLSVKGDIERWPDFKREFPFRVVARAN